MIGALRRQAGKHATLALLSILLLAPAATATLAEGQDLTRLSVEELAKIKVVTVSRRSEAALETPSAIHVITGEDIKRSGATALPDALRLAPGLQASAIDADEWALTVRGFASRLSRSVLVLVDGRSVWTPLFAGVFWDAQDTLLDDVDRIEVSRGPGGPLYGANALNGVVNVITKGAADTQGGLLVIGGGGEERFASARWGGKAGDRLHHRLYAKYLARDGTRPTSSAGYDDEWRLGQGGLRLDWRPSAADSLSFHGDAYAGDAGQSVTIATFTPPFSTSLTGDLDLSGGNAVACWTRALDGGGELRAQAYYDRTSRKELYFDEQRDTVDLDVQHRLRWAGRHDTVWGANYRISHGRFAGVPTLQILPGGRTDDIAGLFVNDEVRISADRLRLSLGAKLEWNDYSGWNVQPGVRAAWVAAPHTFWGSLIRGVRTSSRVERDVLIYSSLSAAAPLFARSTGSPDFEPESVVAFEAGYKVQPLARLLIAVSGFRNRYRDLASNVAGTPLQEPGVPPEPARTVIPVTITNGPGGNVSGAEASAAFSPAGSWRLQAAYSFLDLDLQVPAGAPAPASNSPRHQLWMTSSLRLRSKLDVDLLFRRIGRIAGHRVAAFGELDARLGFRPVPRLELAVVGRNLLQPRHAEFGGGFQLERAFYARATLGF